MFTPVAEETDSKTLRAAAEASKSALPMPGFWEPWPGNTAAVIAGNLPGTEECKESACKPDSVFVWRFLYAANPDGRRAASTRPYLALLPAGFALPAGYPVET